MSATSPENAPDALISAIDVLESYGLRVHIVPNHQSLDDMEHSRSVTVTTLGDIKPIRYNKVCTNIIDAITVIKSYNCTVYFWRLDKMYDANTKHHFYWNAEGAVVTPTQP